MKFKFPTANTILFTFSHHDARIEILTDTDCRFDFVSPDYR